jgi:hypothetical protein
MAYQMITGQRPYESDDTRSALAKLMRGDPYVPPRRILGDLPDALEQVIVRALSRERDQRYARAVDLGAALVAASVPKVAPIADPSIPSPRPPSPLTAAASNVALIPASEPALLPEPASATFTPPPGVGSATPAARPAFVVPLAVAALALLGVTAAIVAWRFTAVPEVTTTELSHPAPTLPTVTVPPTSIPTTVEPTGAAIVVAAPPSDLAGDLAGRHGGRFHRRSDGRSDGHRGAVGPRDPAARGRHRSVDVAEREPEGARPALASWRHRIQRRDGRVDQPLERIPRARRRRSLRRRHGNSLPRLRRPLGATPARAAPL